MEGRVFVNNAVEALKMERTKKMNMAGKGLGLLVAMVTGLMLAATPATASIIQTEVNPANGHTYYLLEDADWSAAEAEAVTLGGHLVTVNDAAENTWLWDTFKEDIGTVGTNYAWIGLTGVIADGTVGWVSGEPYNYDNFYSWAAGHNSAEKNRARINVSYQGGYLEGKWTWGRDNRQDDGGHVDSHYGIVEVPEPMTVTLLLVGLVPLAVKKRRR
ncbi:MAG: lectin-like protein [Planctomycetota bacterium]|nr:lectin-like protein [Planctomycetota bacterium]